MSRHGETQKTGYRQSGVDIDEGNRFISLIKSSVDSTKINGVIGGIGGLQGFSVWQNLKIWKSLFLFLVQMVSAQN